MSEHHQVAAEQKKAPTPQRAPEPVTPGEDGASQEVRALLAENGRAAPSALSPHTLMMLQRTVGNAAVNQLVRRYAAQQARPPGAETQGEDPTPLAQRSDTAGRDGNGTLQAVPEVGLEGGPVSDGLASRINSKRRGPGVPPSGTPDHAHRYVPEHLQRQAAPAAPKSAAELDADYQAALKDPNGADWAKAGEVLNGFNDADIKTRVAQLSPTDRQAMRQALPEWNARVRGALLDLDYREAVARTDWVQAAIHLNGFNDQGIDERLAQLPPGQAGDLAAGAMAGMQGVSQQRIVAAVQRLQQGLDASGDASAGGPLGTAVIADVLRLQQGGADIAVARAAAFERLKLTVRSDRAADKQGDDDRPAAVTKIAAAMAGAVLAEPGMLSEGKLAHTEIGMYYAGLNPPTLVDPSIVAVIRALRLTKAAYNALYARLPEELLESLLVRPDIVDLGKLQVYEIKSADSAGRAVPEMLEYIELLESFNIPGLILHPGSPSNPGTAGVLPVPQGWVVFCCVVPGAIIYRTVRPPENPRHAQERLESELRGTSNQMVGVESMTAISITLVAGFEELIPLLIQAARAAGQAIPKLTPGSPHLSPG